MSQDSSTPPRPYEPEVEHVQPRSRVRRRSGLSAEQRARLRPYIWLALSVLLPLWFLTLSEALFRFWFGRGLPEGRLYELSATGLPLLKPELNIRLSADGALFELHTDAQGLRQSKTERTGERWLVVGDEQTLGWGVQDEETFSEQAGGAGPTFLNAGVPGYGVLDALERASLWMSTEQQAGRPLPDGVVVVFNESDDLEQGDRLARERLSVVDGWLRLKDPNQEIRPVPPRFAHRLHLVYWLSTWSVRVDAAGLAPRFAPAWLVKPEMALPTVQLLADALEAFAREQAQVRVVVLYVPSPWTTSEAWVRRSSFYAELQQAGVQPWHSEGLQKSFVRALPPDLTLLDMRAALEQDASFQENLPLLSPEGHRRVGEALLMGVSRVPPLIQAGEEAEEEPSTAPGATLTPKPAVPASSPLVTDP